MTEQYIIIRDISMKYSGKDIKKETITNVFRKGQFKEL